MLYVHTKLQNKYVNITLKKVHIYNKQNQYFLLSFMLYPIFLNLNLNIKEKYSNCSSQYIFGRRRIKI
jgi:hypothetical protein